MIALLRHPRAIFASFAALLAVGAFAQSENPLVGSWYLTGFESEVNPPDKTGNGSGKVNISAQSIKTVDISEPSPGTLRLVFRDAKGKIIDTEENTVARDGDFFERVLDVTEEGGREHDRFGIQIIRDGLALAHGLGGWFSPNRDILWDAWGAAVALTRAPLPKVNAALWAGPYDGVEWIYSTDWNEDAGHYSIVREYDGELSATASKAGSGYRILVQHGTSEEDDIVTAKVSGSFLAIDAQEKGGTIWDNGQAIGTRVLDRESYRFLQVSDRELVLLGVSGEVSQVTPKSGSGFSPYYTANHADSNILYLVSTANFVFEGQDISIAGPGGGSGPFTAKGLPSGVQINRDTGALTGSANVKPGNYAVTRTAAGLDDTVYFRVQSFPSPLLANPDSPAKLVYGEYEALLRNPLDDTPVGKVELKLAASGLFTGKLHTGAPGPITLKSRFAPDAEGVTASAILPLAGGRSLVLTLGADGLDATLNGGDGVLALAEAGDFSGRIRLHSSASPALGGQAKGNVAYTLALSPAADSEDAPAGHGWATATINPAGLFALKGKLADGRALTASLRATSSGYLPYVKPYGKLADSYLAGRLALSPRDGGGHHVTAADGSLTWSKPAPVNASDRVPAFGPVALAARLEPWTKIVTAEDFAARLGLSGNVLVVSLTGGIPEAEPARSLPESLSFAVSKGKFTSAVAAPVLSEATAAANVKAWAKVWSLSVNLANGTFTGQFVLSDTVLAPTKKNSEATKVVTRKVPFSGVLLSGVSSPFALGHYVVPGLDKAAPTPGGAIELGQIIVR